MKRLMIISFFTLCFSGIAYAQDPAGPSTIPPTIGGGGSEIRIGGSINSNGEVRIGNVRIGGEAKPAGSDAGTGPSQGQGANSGENKRNKDPWEGLRGDGPKAKDPGKGPKDTSPRDKEPKGTGPGDKGPKETGPKDKERRGGRDIP